MPPKKKKGGKGKKKGGSGGVLGEEIRTTQRMIVERGKMLCPRLGDHFTRTMQAEEILEDVAEKTLTKCATKNLEVLALSGMRLAELPDFFQPRGGNSLTHLVEVNLANNNLFNGRKIFEVLAQLPRLRKLNLCRNFLNGCLDESAGDLVTLEELRLDSNQLTSLPSSIRRWKSLKIFTASENYLQALPEEAREWIHLTLLSLRKNQLSELSPRVFEGWGKLQKLSLGFNRLVELPDSISFCVSLSELDLCDNLLTALPESLRLCRQLRRLNIAANKITELSPDLLSSLSHLRDLQLYRNKLTALPPEIGNLRELTRLSLSSNNLKSLPEEIGDCISLQELYLNNNSKFSLFPGSTGQLRNLQELSLRKCPQLKQLPSTAQDLTSLRELDLRLPKKQVCRIAPEVSEMLKANRCVIRGGVITKPKATKTKTSES